MINAEEARNVPRQHPDNDRGGPSWCQKVRDTFPEEYLKLSRTWEDSIRAAAAAGNKTTCLQVPDVSIEADMCAVALASQMRGLGFTVEGIGDLRGDSELYDVSWAEEKK